MAQYSHVMSDLILAVACLYLTVMHYAYVSGTSMANFSLASLFMFAMKTQFGSESLTCLSYFAIGLNALAGCIRFYLNPKNPASEAIKVHKLFTALSTVIFVPFLFISRAVEDVSHHRSIFLALVMLFCSRYVIKSEFVKHTETISVACLIASVAWLFYQATIVSMNQVLIASLCALIFAAASSKNIDHFHYGLCASLMLLEVSHVKTSFA